MRATEIVLREFEPGDEAGFRELNEEWIQRLFTLEPADIATLADAQGKILNRGGRILMAFRDGEPAGCCALLAMGIGEFEVAKNAVKPSAQGLGVGRMLLEALIALARAAGAKRLYLETNSGLIPAMTLYESCGFRRLEGVSALYARGDVRMELLLGNPNG